MNNAIRNSSAVQLRGYTRAIVSFTAVAGLVGLSPLAMALPPSGAGTDTPGTSSTVSPSTVAPCSQVHYEVSGFPSGETVSVKIDDGIGYGDTNTQGTGVVDTQKIGSGGSASGSVNVPCNISEGNHWLRFLASKEADDGTKGYTNRSPEFTVSKSGGDTGGGDSANGGGGDTGGGDSASGGGGDTGGGGSAAGGGNASRSSGSNSTSGGNSSSGGSSSGGSSSGSGSSGSSSGGGAKATTSATKSSPKSSAAKKSSTKSSNAKKSATSTAKKSTKKSGNADDTIQAADASYLGSRTPYVGLFVGGAILLVGMTAINVWVLIQRRNMGQGDTSGGGES